MLPIPHQGKSLELLKFSFELCPKSVWRELISWSLSLIWIVGEITAFENLSWCHLGIVLVHKLHILWFCGGCYVYNKNFCYHFIFNLTLPPLPPPPTKLCFPRVFIFIWSSSRLLFALTLKFFVKLVWFIMSKLQECIR